MTKVAITDDDGIVCSSLQTILTATNTAEIIWTAGNGEQAVAQYTSGPDMRPDVLLIDIQMPGMDGLEAAKRILDFDKTARILFLTTFADKQYISQAVELGAKGYLIKQDVASVAPAVQAVMAGQIVLGAEVLGKLSRSPAGSSTGIDGMQPCLQAPLETLSERECDIAALVAQGLDNKDIAAKLFLSEGTVRNRISDILDKLTLDNRTQLAIVWLNAGR